MGIRCLYQASKVRLFVVGKHESSVLNLFLVELFGPDDGLGCIVDEYVQFCNVGEQVVDQVIYLFLGEKVALDYMQSIFPLIIVFLGLISQQCVVREPGGGIDHGTVPQQLQTYLKTDLYAATSDQGSESFEICRLSSFGKVEGGTGRAKVTVEGMNLSVLSFTNMAQHSYCLFFYWYACRVSQRRFELFVSIFRYVFDLGLDCLLVYCCFQSLLPKQHPLLFSFSHDILNIIVFNMKELAHLAENSVYLRILLLVVSELLLLEDLFEFLQGG